MARAPFFPYDPRTMRLWVAAALVLCAGLAAWALVDALFGGGLSGWARLGLLIGLGTAFTYLLVRLRPRQDWGVRLEPSFLIVSRPLSGGLLEVPWESVVEVRKDGPRGERLLVLTRPEGRILLARHLFRSRRQFDELALALTARAPPRRHDA